MLLTALPQHSMTPLLHHSIFSFDHLVPKLAQPLAERVHAGRHSGRERCSEGIQSKELSSTAVPEQDRRKPELE